MKLAEHVAGEKGPLAAPDPPALARPCMWFLAEKTTWDCRPWLDLAVFSVWNFELSSRLIRAVKCLTSVMLPLRLLLDVFILPIMAEFWVSMCFLLVCSFYCLGEAFFLL